MLAVLHGHTPPGTEKSNQLLAEPLRSMASEGTARALWVAIGTLTIGLVVSLSMPRTLVHSE